MDGIHALDDTPLTADGSLVLDGGLAPLPDCRAFVSAEPASASEQADRRRAAWHWLNSISSSQPDRDNDWSDV